jgi:hypothetical protein
MFPYDAEVLAAAYAQYNAAVWPAQLIALLLALAVLWLCVSPRPWGGYFTGAALAAAWLWCGLVFYLAHFAAYDFMAPVYGWVFVAQAVLLAGALLWRPLPMALPPEAPPGPRAVAGLVLAAFALFGLPLISGLGTSGFATARVVGVAPGPTVLFTLGLLLLATGWRCRLLMVVPLAWCALAGVMAWALGVAEAWPLPLLGLAALGLSLWPAQRAT